MKQKEDRSFVRLAMIKNRHSGLSNPFVGTVSRWMKIFHEVREMQKGRVEHPASKVQQSQERNIKDGLGSGRTETMQQNERMVDPHEGWHKGNNICQRSCPMQLKSCLPRQQHCRGVH